MLKKSSFAILLLVSLCLFGRDPVFYMPLDESATVFGAGGKEVGKGIVYGAAKYMKGVIGKGLDIKRHAYDQVTSLNVAKLPAVDVNNGTVAFWYKPHWKETDPEGFKIFTGRDTAWKNFRFYFIKAKSGFVELSVVAPKQIQILRKNILKQDKWQHVAFTWEQSSGTVKLYVDGVMVDSRTLPGAISRKPDARAISLFFGDETYDRFKTKVGNGIYDDVKYYDCVLSQAEIFALASGGATDKMASVPVDGLVSEGGRTVRFMLGNAVARYAGPKKLLNIKGTEGREIDVIAMGASGRVSLSVRSGKQVVSLESSYTFQLDKPFCFELRQVGKTLNWLIDGGDQGKLELENEFGNFVGIEKVGDVTVGTAIEAATLAGAGRLADTKKSSLETSLWTLDDASHRIDGVRRGVCLNGYWRVQTCNDYSFAPPHETWGYVRVPGSFRSPLYDIHTAVDGKLERKHPAWLKGDKIMYRCGWYQRMFNVPADMRKAGRIYLNMTNVNGDNGRIYLNGKLLDSFRQDLKCFTMVPNVRRIDITDKLGSGDGDNVLTVFVDRRHVGLWQGMPAIGDHQEIALDDIWLESVPGVVTVKTAVAMTSFRKKDVTVRVRLGNVQRLRGDYEVSAVFSRPGEKDVSVSGSVALTGDAEQVVLLNGPWENPTLWNYESPNLYDMSVVVKKGSEILDSYPVQKVGFREAWVEGKSLLVNGRPTRLRMWSSPGLERLRQYYGVEEAIDQYVGHIKDLNYDSVRVNPIGKTSQVGWQFYLNACDRQGVYNLFPMPPYDGGDLAIYRESVERYFEAYGNHPSVFMWYTDFNTCSYPWNQDPAKLIDREYAPSGKIHPRKLANVAEATIRALDSTREAIRHAGGCEGKIFTSMNYQSYGTPMQEQEDWPKLWAEKGTQPLISIECAFPYPMQFWHFDNAKLGSLGAEHAARYFGDRVYGAEDRPIPHSSNWLNSPYASWNANMLELSKMHYRRVIRAWRGYGMTGIGDFPGGRDQDRAYRTYDRHSVVYRLRHDVKAPGLKPDVIDHWAETQRHLLSDYTQHEAFHDVIKECFEPLMVYLGGPVNDFTNKDHGYFSGESFQKSIVVINDKTTEQDLEFRWELVMAGKVMQNGVLKRRIEDGGLEKLPIDLKAPEVYKRTEGELRLVVLRNGRLLSEDCFALQFFPKHVPPTFKGVATGVYDPVGKTVALLKQAGFPFREVKTVDDVKACKLLIIGAGALQEKNPQLLKEVETAGLIEAGLKLLVFEQASCNMANLVFESPSYRDAFIRRRDSEFVAGLEDEDFSNWRGSAKSVPEFVMSAENSPHYPRSKWKWGNGGIVAGNVIRKPSYGNFTTIVDCGFNLMHAGLLELRKGHGRILFCQLDVSDRYGIDPVATQLVDRMLTVMSNHFVPIGGQFVWYLGDETGEVFLKRMGVSYRRMKTDEPWTVTQRQVTILGPNHGIEAKHLESYRRKFAEATVIALPGADLSLLDSRLKIGMRKAFRATAPKDDVLFNGLTDGDLYFRTARDVKVVEGLHDWERATSPALIAKLDKVTTVHVIFADYPSSFGGLWNEEKMTRVWSTLLTNMNIAQGDELQVFTASKSRHNTQKYCFGEIKIEQMGLKLDFNNSGKVTDREGFEAYKIGLSWESRGFTTVNPLYVYPTNTPKNLKKMYDGYAWLRCDIDIPANWKGRTLRLVGGPIDDADWTYWNEKKIGETLLETNPKSYSTKRSYVIPPEHVVFGGRNTLMIHVFDRWGDGGVTGDLSVVAEDEEAKDAWSPYVDKLDFYDGDAFHNW